MHTLHIYCVLLPLAADRFTHTLWSTSLAPGQSHDCLSANRVTLENKGQIDVGIEEIHQNPEDKFRIHYSKLHVVTFGSTNDE